MFDVIFCDLTQVLRRDEAGVRVQTSENVVAEILRRLAEHDAKTRGRRARKFSARFRWIARGPALDGLMSNLLTGNDLADESIVDAFLVRNRPTNEPAR
jgi:hypothetical protein